MFREARQRDVIEIIACPDRSPLSSAKTKEKYDVGPNITNFDY